MEVENSLGPPYGGRHANQIKGRHEHQFRPLGPTGRTEHSRSHMHFPLLTLLPILAVQMGSSPFCLLSNDWVVRDRNLPVLLRGRNKASRLSMASFSAGRLGQSAQSACQRLNFLRAVLKFSRMYFYSRINFFGRADPLCRPKMGGKFSPNFGYSRCQSAKFLRPTLKFSRMYFYSRINFFVPATPKICGFGRAGQRLFFLRFWAIGAIRRGQSVRRLECLREVCYHLLVSSLVWIYGDLFLPSSEVYLHS